jgi:predicted DNA binding CopG/RHH family protein
MTPAKRAAGAKFTREAEALLKTADLPAPDQLVLKEETVKVTLALGKDSVRFFKRQAKRQKVPYQRMIKNLVDRYAESYREG